MDTHADKTQENKGQSVSAATSQMQSSEESTLQFVDNRPEAVAQRKLQEVANNRPQLSQLRALQEMANNSPQVIQAAQLQTMAPTMQMKAGVNVNDDAALEKEADVMGAKAISKASMKTSSGQSTSVQQSPTEATSSRTLSARHVPVYDGSQASELHQIEDNRPAQYKSVQLTKLVNNSPRAQYRAHPQSQMNADRVLQRDPEAEPVARSDRMMYHITKIENFHMMVARGGLMPLNWIIEGTHGQAPDESSQNRGLDAQRGASQVTTLEAHRHYVEQAEEAWTSVKGTGMANAIGKRYADAKLGRKRDFVYGTRRGDTLASYADTYRSAGTELASLVILRWVQAGEDYYVDLEDTNAIKSLSSVPLGRLEVAVATNVGDATPEKLAGLNWLAASNLPGLIAAHLLPPPPTPVDAPLAVTPTIGDAEQADDTLPTIEELEALIAQDDLAEDDELAELERQIALDELADDEELAELERQIAEDEINEDQMIAEMEAELGPEAVAEIERQLAIEMADEVAEHERIMAIADLAIEQAAPSLREAHDLEAQVELVMQEAATLIDQQDAIAERLAAPVQRQSPAPIQREEVIQLIYDDAEFDIGGILEELASGDHDDAAEAISQLPQLDSVSKSDLTKVERLVMQDDSAKQTLAAAFSESHAAFAKALLLMIASIPDEVVSDSESAMTEQAKTPDFTKLITQAVVFHAPRLGGLIDQANAKAKKSGKKLLVIVGEQHDNPYGRVMITILAGAMQRLSASHFYIEATPAAVKQHVEPFSVKKPEATGSDDIAHKQHFFRALYEQGLTIEGIDTLKESSKQEAIEILGPMPEKDPARAKWKATFMEMTVAARNEGIAKAVTAAPESGIMMVGLTHLPGLASNATIRQAYEIVCVAAALPDVAVTRDIMMYGNLLSHTKALTEMDSAYSGGVDEDLGVLDSEKAFALAKAMVVELNQV